MLQSIRLKNFLSFGPEVAKCTARALLAKTFGTVVLLRI